MINAKIECPECGTDTEGLDLVIEGVPNYNAKVHIYCRCCGGELGWVSACSLCNTLKDNEDVKTTD